MRHAWLLLLASFGCGGTEGVWVVFIQTPARAPVDEIICDENFIGDIPHDNDIAIDGSWLLSVEEDGNPPGAVTWQASLVTGSEPPVLVEFPDFPAQASLTTSEVFEMPYTFVVTASAPGEAEPRCDLTLTKI